MTAKRTLALKLAYDGGPFHGWQKQPGQRTVQGAVEDALTALLGKRYVVHGAGRTDKGVHALAQVASFQCGREGDLARLSIDGVTVLAAVEASPSFHARASSEGKRYRYRFCHGAQRDPAAFFLGSEARPDWERARTALAALEGLPSLTGLASPSADRKPAPPLTSWALPDEGVLDVEARAFRKHEVRNLAGHLATIALGLAEPRTLAELAQRARPWMGATAPPHGLTLVEVLYPRELDPFR